MHTVDKTADLGTVTSVPPASENFLGFCKIPRSPVRGVRSRLGRLLFATFCCVRASSVTNEVQKEVLKSKAKVRESSKGGSPFTPEIQDKPLPANFKLPALELYDGSCDPTEHAYARTEVGKRHVREEDLDITFGSGNEEYPNHDDTLVISIRIANARVKRVMIDT
ncbi:hypothetical protein GW17_00036772 [Ensete ventricosum]|nr:hypothetical protein GW17_00036772 [Ensete ventricosum]